MGAIKEGPNHGDRRQEGSGEAPHGSPSRLFRLPRLVGEMLGQKWRGKEAMKRLRWPAVYALSAENGRKNRLCSSLIAGEPDSEGLSLN